MTPRDTATLKRLLAEYHISCITDTIATLCNQTADKIHTEHPDWNKRIEESWHAHATVMYLAGEATKAQTRLANVAPAAPPSGDR